MGNKDNIVKKYFKDNNRFADIFNFMLFQGEDVIKPSELSVSDPVLTYSGVSSEDSRKRKERILDLSREAVIKKDEETVYVLLGLENESEIRYDMPVRVMLGDAIRYHDQIVALRRIHKKNKDLKKFEYLSGISANDRIKKVITLIFYLNDKPWVGPRSLYDLFETDDLGLECFVPNYKLNLLIPDEIENIEKFSSDLGILVEFIKKGKNRYTLEKLLEEKADVYSALNDETAQMIEAYAGYKIGRKSNEKGEVDVCTGLNELKEDLLAEGKAEGEIIGSIRIYSEELGLLPSEIIEKIERRFDLKHTDAEKYVAQVFATEAE